MLVVVCLNARVVLDALIVVDQPGRDAIWYSVAGQGRQNGTKFKSTCVSLNTQRDVEHMQVMGFPPHHRFPPTEPEAPVPPPVAGASLMNQSFRLEAVSV
jgi:hypothetical protein